MNTHRISAGAIPAAFLASCSIGGVRIALAPPDLDIGIAEFKAAIDGLNILGCSIALLLPCQLRGASLRVDCGLEAVESSLCGGLRA